MSDPTHARRAVMQLGDHKLDVFQLPDGSYRMSQTQVAEAVGKPERSFRDFLSSKWLKALPGLESDSANFSSLRREGEPGASIRGVPLLFVSAYWLKEAIGKNKQAQALAWACIQETLVRRADAAFGVSRNEDEYNQLFSQLESIIEEQDEVIRGLELEYATDDVARENFEHLTEEVRRLSDRLRELGEDPYA